MRVKMSRAFVMGKVIRYLVTNKTDPIRGESLPNSFLVRCSIDGKSEDVRVDAQELRNGNPDVQIMYDDPSSVVRNSYWFAVKVFNVLRHNIAVSPRGVKQMEEFKKPASGQS